MNLNSDLHHSLISSVILVLLLLSSPLNNKPLLQACRGNPFGCPLRRKQHLVYSLVLLLIHSWAWKHEHAERVTSASHSLSQPCSGLIFFIFFNPISRVFIPSHLRRASITSRQLDMNIKVLQIRGTGLVGCFFLSVSRLVSKQESEIRRRKVALSKDFISLLHRKNDSLFTGVFGKEVHRVCTVTKTDIMHPIQLMHYLHFVLFLYQPYGHISYHNFSQGALIKYSMHPLNSQQRPNWWE